VGGYGCEAARSYAVHQIKDGVAEDYRNWCWRMEPAFRAPALPVRYGKAVIADRGGVAGHGHGAGSK
jgi:hypothetical protein